ncbi:MAG TPA: hypothetical protein PLL37_09980 [Bacillota bacterium]|nr:hypothetical protein [Bacillota bacterium]
MKKIIQGIKGKTVIVFGAGDGGRRLTAYTGTSGRRFRKHPDTKPEVSGHFAG